MNKDKWLVSVMIGFGRSAQFVMTDGMSYCEAYEFAEEIIQRAEDGHWIEIGHTFINPANITTIRVVKERPGYEPYALADYGEC